jgi:hypothetical protein
MVLLEIRSLDTFPILLRIARSYNRPQCAGIVYGDGSEHDIVKLETGGGFGCVGSAYRLQ